MEGKWFFKPCGQTSIEKRDQPKILLKKHVARTIKNLEIPSKCETKQRCKRNAKLVEDLKKLWTFIPYLQHGFHHRLKRGRCMEPLSEVGLY